jgi:hypothetical protein
MRRTGILRKTPLKKVSAKPRRERFEHLKDDAYRQWVRDHSCLVAGVRDEEDVPHRCWGTMEAAHVRTKATGSGDRMNLVPLCTLAHRIQHTVGIKSFQRRYRIRLDFIAAQLDAEYEAERIGHEI